MLHCFLFEDKIATYHPSGISDHSLRDTSAAVLGVEAREGPNTQDRDKHLIVLYCHLFAYTMATYHPLGIADSSPSAERRPTVLAIEFLEGLNTKDQAGRLIMSPKHLFKDMMTTCGPCENLCV